MITQAVDQQYFMSRSRQITAQIPSLLSQRGLLPKFRHWRLMQDAETNLVVLFGLLDYQYITTHTTTQFSAYFEPRLLRDLAKELQVQVTSSSNDGLRYTFILERGQFDLSTDKGDEHTLMHQRLSTFLKATGSINSPNKSATQPLPDVLFMDEAEFNQQMTEYEVMGWKEENYE